MHSTKLLALASIAFVFLTTHGGGCPDKKNKDEAPKKQKELLIAIKDGKLDDVKKILKDHSKDVDLNSYYKFDKEDYDQELPLTYALKKKNLDIVKELLANKAKVDVKNKDGKTVKDVAGGMKLDDAMQKVINDAAGSRRL